MSDFVSKYAEEADEEWEQLVPTSPLAEALADRMYGMFGEWNLVDPNELADAVNEFNALGGN